VALKILQNIEKNKQQESERLKKLQERDEQQKFIERQREIANQNLLNDLSMWFEQLDPFNPRNAFASFASQMDSAVQDIYWAQFNFTETKTREGLAALQAVLDNGGSEQDARKAFYETAATPREHLLKINDDFNARYGTTSNVTNSD
jgi:molecular chaperone DnaK (HSP70)